MKREVRQLARRLLLKIRETKNDGNGSSFPCRQRFVVTSFVPFFLHW